MIFKLDEFKKLNEIIYDDVLSELEEFIEEGKCDYTMDEFKQYGIIEAFIRDEKVYYSFGLSEAGCRVLNLNNINCIANQPTYAEDNIKDLPEDFINKIKE